MIMKVLAVNGSSRKNGNTEILLKQALMGAESEEAQDFSLPSRPPFPIFDPYSITLAFSFPLIFKMP